MRLVSVCGDTLFRSSYITIKESVEEAVSEGVCLTGINLRGAKLCGAQLDGAKMKGACLWGADLTGADMSDGLFHEADFRTAVLKDTCFADSVCIGVNFHGTYFSKTILNGADLSKATFSCPSLFSCDLTQVENLHGAVYSHQGEMECALDSQPIVIYGLSRPVIILNNDVLIGGQCVPKTCFGASQKEILTEISKGLLNHRG